MRSVATKPGSMFTQDDAACRRARCWSEAGERGASAALRHRVAEAPATLAGRRAADPSTPARRRDVDDQPGSRARPSAGQHGLDERERRHHVRLEVARRAARAACRAAGPCARDRCSARCSRARRRAPIAASTVAGGRARATCGRAGRPARTSASWPAARDEVGGRRRGSRAAGCVSDARHGRASARAPRPLSRCGRSPRRRSPPSRAARRTPCRCPGSRRVTNATTIAHEPDRRALPASVRLGGSYGLWRSLVARFVRDEEVPGSSPGSPTTVTQRRRAPRAGPR